MVDAARNLHEVWTQEERHAWSPPERLSPSAWAERYHLLDRRDSAEPGPYRLDRTPYMREILDVLGDSQHTEVTLCKCAQIGGTAVAKAIIGYWIDDGDGDSIICGLPNQKAAEAYIQERIQPLLENPRLARYVTERSYDVTKGQVDLSHCSIFAGWSGSAQTLASRSCRRAISDETDKAQDLAKEAGSLDLIRDRLITYGFRAKHFVLSTPTSSDGPIWSAWTRTADKRHYHVPCPSCGASHRLVWEQVRWDGYDLEDRPEGELLQLADDLLSGRAHAWYECPHCHGRLEERDRMRSVEAGEWVSELGPNPVSASVAYHISALYSPWVSFARLVSEHLKAVVSQDSRNFRNAYLGLPNEDGPISRREGDVFTPRAKLHRAGVVPSWATTLTAGADTQAKSGHPYWCWVIRAWGPRHRSRLIAAGKAHTPEDLIRSTVDARFQVEGGGVLSPTICCIDSGGGSELSDGNTTMEVYQLARRDPGRMIAVKGHGGRIRPDRLIRASNVTYQPPGSSAPPLAALLHVLDTQSLKDQLAALIYSEDQTLTLWEESDCLPEGYVTQMTAEERTRVKLGKRSEVRWVNHTRSRSDWWDASVYALAGAHMLRADERAQKRQQQAPAGNLTPPPGRFQEGRRMSINRDRPWISRR